jgi:hypothetical protein
MPPLHHQDRRRHAPSCLRYLALPSLRHARTRHPLFFRRPRAPLLLGAPRTRLLRTTSRNHRPHHSRPTHPIGTSRTSMASPRPHSNRRPPPHPSHWRNGARPKLGKLLVHRAHALASVQVGDNRRQQSGTRALGTCLPCLVRVFIRLLPALLCAHALRPPAAER